MHTPRHARRWAGGAAATAGLALLVSSIGSPGYAGQSGSPDSEEFRDSVTRAGIQEHLDALQAIATAHDGTRASGTAGYDQSRDYVVSRLRQAGYAPTVQAFDFPFFKENSPSTLAQTSPDATTYENGTDFATMTYSGSGTVAPDAAITVVDTDVTPTDASTSGCEATDFTGFPAGNVALIQRGSCTFGAKVENAATAGASAAIIFNRGTEGAEDAVAGTLGAPGSIPALGASFALGQDLADPAGTRVSLSTDTIAEIRETYNVHAETSTGSDREVVQAGAHLDSVIDGEGLNDNGSGSASLLEVAEQLADEPTEHQVRFSWWGAEELGLLGSEHYVADLAANDRRTLNRIAMYLNFDMVGSPNYVRFVYDGDNSRYGGADGAATGPKGSGEIESLFHQYFAGQGLASEETPFSGRSDYGPFIAEGIASGGLFTGAEGVKTTAQAIVYGGTAGEAYDECYHQECDDITNVNMQAIDEMSDAMAHAVYTYSMDARSVTNPNAGARTFEATGTDAKRAAQHDYDKPNGHVKRR